MSKKHSAFGLASGFLWAIGIIFSSFIFLSANISPFTVALYHDFVSVIFLCAIILWKFKKINFKIFLDLKNYAVVLAAILAGPIGMQANLYAIKYLGTSLTSSITALYPVVAVFLSYIFLKQKMTRLSLIGIVCIVGGLFAQTFAFELTDALLIGILFAIGCAVAWGSESVLSVYTLTNNVSEIEALLLRQVTSFISYLMIIAFIGENIFIVFDYSSEFYLNVIMMVISNVLSYLFYYSAIDKLGAAKATGLNVSYVIWTVMLSYLFLGKTLDLQIVASSMVIIFGIYLIVREETGGKL